MNEPFGPRTPTNRPAPKALKDLMGKRMAGGPHSVNALAKLLGLAEHAPSYAVRAVAWVYDHLELSLGRDEGEDLVFTLERAKAGRTAFLSTPHLTVTCRSRDIPREVGDLLLGCFSAKWKNLSFEKLAGLVIGDPDLGKPGLPLPPQADEFRGSRSLLDTWGAPGGFADFFARGEFERAQLDSVDYFQDCINIQHSDLECCNAAMNVEASSIKLVNFPWNDALGASPSSPERESGREGGEDGDIPRMLITDLGEQEVIMGSNEKVKQVLDYVGSLNTKKMVFFSNTCVPTVTGEDVESVIKRYQAKSKTPLMFLTVTPQSMTAVFKGLLVDRRLDAEAKVPVSEAGKINLIGFQRDRHLDELTTLLSGIGIEINTVLLPKLRYPEIDLLPRAALNVFLPNSIWQHLYDQLLVGTRLRYIFPEAPYGMEGTERWLLAIASALGVEAAAKEAVKAGREEHEEEWSALKEEAASLRLALVARSDELHYLIDPAHTWGVPLVRLLQEMGFGLDVTVRVPEGTDPEPLVATVESLFRSGHPHKVSTFDRMESMLEALRGSESAAVFTNHFFDWRITSSGKTPFSLQVFKKGLGGAVVTLRRLLQLCRTPFYGRYSRYLRRTPGGAAFLPPTNPAFEGKP